jgi:creatinine amidohydrolase/Fe(II)-dependent formamide hydrolase-like protein
LRAFVADLGDQIAQNHFKWILVLSHHGAPPHQEAINQACDFVAEADHMTMVNLTALVNEDPEANILFEEKIQPKYYSDADLKSFGVEIHAGKDETSVILAEQPAAVRSMYRTLPQQSGSNIPALGSLARKPGWPGYFGAPAAANAAFGKELLELLDSTAASLAQRILKGEDLLQHPRSPGSMMADPQTRATVEDESDDAKAFGAKLQEWLADRKTLRK